jgi:quercetin dioxygenase-like cupin family protein
VFHVAEVPIVQVASFFNIEDVGKQRQQSGKRYFEFLRVPAMSAGVYVLSAGSTDPQPPHKEDEMYYVVRGRGCMRAGSDDQAVSEGSVIFVAAGVEHRFHEITEELTVLVFFAPAESE